MQYFDYIICFFKILEYLCNTNNDNKQTFYDMRTNYIIKSFDGSETSIFTTSNTKRDIIARFNRLMKKYAKDSKYCVENIRIGYSKVTFFGTFGMYETEYWIERA